MRSFVYENSTKVYFGEGCVREHLEEALKPYGDNILLGFGQGSVYRNGVYDEVTAILRKAGKHVIEFSGIMPNPTYRKVLEGKQLVKEHHIDLILAMGGGSVMDCCKAVAVAASTEKDFFEHFWEVNEPIDFPLVPVGIIETVPGTGSEVNGCAVVTHEEKKIKTDHDYMELNARFSFLDPTYTYSVSPVQTAAGGFDMLSHVLEVYFSEPDDNNLSDAISEAIMRDIIRNLPEALKNPESYAARSALMWDASMAETRHIKLGKQLDFEAHQIEHQMSAYTDCNHGAGLAAIMPVYYRHILKDGQKKFAMFAENVWGISPEGRTEEELAEAGLAALEKFITDIGLPRSLRELGFGEKEKEMLPAIADSTGINHGGYRALTRDEVLEILQESW